MSSGYRIGNGKHGWGTRTQMESYQSWKINQSQEEHYLHTKRYIKLCGCHLINKYKIRLITYIIIAESGVNGIFVVRNEQSADVGGNHHLLMCVVRLRVCLVKTTMQCRGRKYYNIQRLKDEETRNKCGIWLTQVAEGVESERDIVTKWDHTKVIQI